MDLNLIYARGYVGYTLQQLFNYTQDPKENYHYIEMAATGLRACQLSTDQLHLGCLSGQTQSIMKNYISTASSIQGVSDTIMIIDTLTGEIYKNFLISSNNDIIGDQKDPSIQLRFLNSETMLILSANSNQTVFFLMQIDLTTNGVKAHKYAFINYLQLTGLQDHIPKEEYRNRYEGIYTNWNQLFDYYITTNDSQVDSFVTYLAVGAMFDTLDKDKIYVLNQVFSEIIQIDTQSRTCKIFVNSRPFIFPQTYSPYIVSTKVYKSRVNVNTSDNSKPTVYLSGKYYQTSFYSYDILDQNNFKQASLISSFLMSETTRSPTKIRFDDRLDIPKNMDPQSQIADVLTVYHFRNQTTIDFREQLSYPEDNQQNWYNVSHGQFSMKQSTLSSLKTQINYQIGAKLIEIEIDFDFIPVTNCTFDKREFKVTFIDYDDNSKNAPLNELIKFKDMKTSIFSQNKDLAGRYKVLFQISSPFEKLFQHKFDLIVKKNNLPLFVKIPKTISVRLGETLIIRIPNYIDLDQDDLNSLKLEILYNNNLVFPPHVIKDHQSIIIQPKYQNELGNNYITYILTDQKQGQTNYTQKIMIQNPIKNKIQQTQNSIGFAIETIFHLPSIQSIDNIGMVTVKFGKSISVDYIKEARQTVKDFIDLNLTNMNNYNNYDLISLSQNELKIKLNFNYPLLISQQDKTDYLSIMFYGKILGIGNDYKKVQILTLQHEIPQQLSSEDQQLYLNRTSGILQSIVITLLTTNAGLTLIQSAGMQLVWGFLNAQQILSHVQLFNLDMPSNINYFYDLIQGSLKFQIYSALPITKFIFSIDKDDKSFNQAFADFGYDQTSLILNLDMLFYIYLLYPVLVVLYFVVDVLSAFSTRYNYI
eukprot:403374905